MFFSSNRNQVRNFVDTNKPQTAETEKPLPRRLSIVREFALNTSTHALPGIARSQSKHNRIFWSVSFIIFTGVMTYFITESLIKYFQYPTQTNVDMVVERSQKFPAVTVCNYCPARFDRIVGPLINYTLTRNLSNSSTFSVETLAYINSFFIDLTNANEPLDDFFFQLEIMLIDCIYNGEKCNSSDFISFTSAAYGLCYTFNAQRLNSTGRRLRYTNDNAGFGKLQLRLYPHSHLYIPFVTAGRFDFSPFIRKFQTCLILCSTLDVTVGMVALIHDNTELPLIDVAGIELGTGQKHKLSYKKRNNIFLPSPYTDCTMDIPPAMDAMFKNYRGADYVYSQGVCYTICIQSYV